MRHEGGNFFGIRFLKMNIFNYGIFKLDIYAYCVCVYINEKHNLKNIVYYCQYNGTTQQGEIISFALWSTVFISENSLMLINRLHIVMVPGGSAVDCR